jgi:hypothetical protein
MLTSSINDTALIIEHYLNGNYKQFQKCLDQIQGALRFDPMVGEHTHNGPTTFRDIRLKALKQYIQAYKVLTLNEIASEFSQSIDQIEKDLVELISSGHLEYRINDSS